MFIYKKRFTPKFFSLSIYAIGSLHERLSINSKYFLAKIGLISFLKFINIFSLLLLRTFDNSNSESILVRENIILFKFNRTFLK